jgi:hypothetical protein
MYLPLLHIHNLSKENLQLYKDKYKNRKKFKNKYISY